VERNDPGSVVLRGREGRIASQRAIWELQEVMPPTTRYSSDIGEHMLFAVHHLQVDDPRGFAIMSGLASMGSGIGAALGMKIAHPDIPVVSICGDGCFSMGLGAIATAARERIPLVIAVLNDERYGMVEIGNTVVYGRTEPYPAGPTSITDVARALGADGVVIEEPGDILLLDLMQMSLGGPVILDVRIDQSIHMSRARLELLKKAASHAAAN
jgi:acetolactate synthase-1/2/3 large subunit